MESPLFYFSGLATLVFINTGLVVAAIRWFHMCRPYDRHPRYYYPGRPFVVGIYLNALVLLPYVFHPESTDAWYLARLYFLPVTLFHFTLLLFSYFGNVMQWRKWRGPALISGLPMALALLAGLALALWPGEQITDGGLISPFAARCVIYILGLMATALCFSALVIVLRWASDFDEDEFSNPADFPVMSMRKWNAMILVNTMFCWVGALAGSRALLAVLMVLLAVSAVIFIITALHPNRNRPVQEPEEELSRQDNPALKGKTLAALRETIHRVLVEEEAFVDPHLTIQDVADRCGYSRSYVAALFRTEFGGFFAYVNSLRLEHVDAYLRENPDATIQEAAEVSGFISRQAYYNVKTKLQR